MYKKSTQFPLFPILFVITIVLVFYYTFSEDALPSSLFVTLIYALLLMVVVWGLFFILTKDLSKSAVLTFISSLMVFFFQSLIGLLSSITKSLGFSNTDRFWIQTRGQWLAFSIIMILEFLIYLLVSHVKKIRPVLMQLLNLFGLIMLILVSVRVMVQIGQGNVQKEAFNAYWANVQTTQIMPISTPKSETPDIYYIILDEFGRSDMLKRVYGVDNTGFIDALKNRGFYVADESYSNYTQTRTSIASSLNMMYLDEVSGELQENTTFSYPAYYMIEDSIVENTLCKSGYEMVGFESEMGFLSFTDWDKYYHQAFIPDNYSRTFMNSSVLSILLNQTLYDWHRQEIDYTLRTLPFVEKNEKPRFIFAHILCPHPPFVYNNDGSIRKNNYLYTTRDANSLLINIDDEEYTDGYANQVVYLQARLLELFDQIRTNSSHPFIIVLQGDHGSGLNFDHNDLKKSDISERLGILNAYYFYDQNYQDLYPQISPVNTFRVIFSQYLGLKEPLLEDHHYYSSYDDLFNFVLVDDQLR